MPIKDESFGKDVYRASFKNDGPGVNMQINTGLYFWKLQNYPGNIKG